MKNLLSASGFSLLAGFALFSPGCVAQYETSTPATSYSSTVLPAVGTVALIMEFRGGEPTPEERADVRALLTDYFSQQGTVLVEDPDAADYLVHAVLERRNPENPTEWTVVETYSANSLRSAVSDEFRWPGGLIEDDYYDTTTYSYVGFGIFYPVFFDLWSHPWHRGQVILRPLPRRHNHWNNDRWRDDHRWHRPARWHDDRRPDGSDRKRPDRNRDGRRDRDDSKRGDRRDNDRRDGDRSPDTDRRLDNDRGPNNDRRPDSEGRGRPDRGRIDSNRPSTPVPALQRPAGGDARPPGQAGPPRIERPRPVDPSQVAPSSRPTSAPAVRREPPRRHPVSAPGSPATVRPRTPSAPASPPPQIQPADRRAGSLNQRLPGRGEQRGHPAPEVRERVRHTSSGPPSNHPPQLRHSRPDQTPAPPRQATAPREEPRRRAFAPPAERARPSNDRPPPPQSSDKGNDREGGRPAADQGPQRR